MTSNKESVDRRFTMICEAARALAARASPVESTEPPEITVTSASSSSASGALTRLLSWGRSILAYYDLADNDPQRPWLEQDSLHDDYQSDFQHLDTLEANVDDAQLRFRTNHTHVSNSNVALSNTDANEPNITVTQLVGACNIILNYSRNIITQNNQGADMLPSLPVLCSATFDSSEKHPLNQDSHQVIHGMTLHRNGYHPLSFYSFCQHAIQSATNSESWQPLQHFVETSLDIIMQILIASGFALFSEDADAIILFPLSSPSVQESIQKSYLDNHRLHTKKSTVPIRFSEMDIAIFKLTHASWMLEQRISQLSTSIESLQKLALSAQRKNNTNLALIQMKKRKMAMDEMERLQPTLLNIESGLQCLQRAKNDVHIMKSYQLLHSTLKSVEGMGLTKEHIHDLMDSIHENTEELNWIHEELAMVHNRDVDSDELEREFQALELECRKKESEPKMHPKTTVLLEEVEKKTLKGTPESFDAGNTDALIKSQEEKTAERVL